MRHPLALFKLTAYFYFFQNVLMKNYNVFTLRCLSIVITFLISVDLYSKDTDEYIHAGVSAETVITPEKISLAGYIQRRTLYESNETPNARIFKPSLGVLDYPRVKVVLLKNKTSTLALISMDLIAIQSDIRMEIFNRTKDIFSNLNQIQLFATHTHSGPGGYIRMPFWEQLAVDKFNALFYEKLISSAERAIRKAVANLQPVLVGKRESIIEGVSVNRRNSPLLNPRLNVIRIDNLNRKNIANIINFPIHGNYLPAENLMLSRDIPGLIEQYVEDKTSAMSMFISGPAGDVNPKTEELSSKGLNSLGRRISEEVYKAISNTKLKFYKSIDISQTEYSLPLAQTNIFQCLASALPDRFSWIRKIPWVIDLPSSLNLPAPLFSIKIDDIFILTVPGEPITELGLRIEKMASDSKLVKPMIFTLGNTYMGYILTKEEFRRGGYETCNSFYGETYGEKFLIGVKELIDKVL